MVYSCQLETRKQLIARLKSEIETLDKEIAELETENRTWINPLSRS